MCLEIFLTVLGPEVETTSRSGVMDYKKLYATLEKWRNVPFDFKTKSCCHFVADVVYQTTGRRLNVPHLDGPEQAIQWIQKMGHSSLHSYLVSLFGQPIPILKAKRGDIAYAQLGLEGGAIGIVERGAWFVSDNGLILRPLKECICAFKLE